MHCAVLRTEYDRVRARLRAKEDTEKRRGGKIKKKTGWMTSQAAQEQKIIDDAAAVAKAQADKEAEDRKQREQEENEARWRAEPSAGTAYKGSIRSKKHDELALLAAALMLSTSGTNTELVDRIKMHLAHHPELEANPRFVGLFVSTANGLARLASSSSSSGPVPAPPVTNSSLAATSLNSSRGLPQSSQYAGIGPSVPLSVSSSIPSHASSLTQPAARTPHAHSSSEYLLFISV
jgi:hypothetical protein